MALTNQLTGLFENWLIDPDIGVLFDDSGNSYDLNEIRSIFFTRQLVSTLTGQEKCNPVVSLKQHLETKIRATQIPEVTVKWGDGTELILTHNSQVRA